MAVAERAITEEERQRFEEALATAKKIAKINWIDGPLLVLANVTTFSAFVTFLAFFAVFLISFLFNALWTFLAIILVLVFGVTTAIGFGYAIAETAQDQKTSRAWVRNLSADIEAGVVCEESVELSEVKRFRESEHGTKLYLIRTTDGRVRSMDCHSGKGEYMDRYVKALGPQLRRHAVFRWGPRSKMSFHEFSGDKLRLPRFRDLRHPENWPRDESWVDIDWENAETLLSGAPNTSK